LRFEASKFQGFGNYWQIHFWGSGVATVRVIMWEKAGKQS